MTPRTIPLSIALGVTILAATIYFAWTLPEAAWVTDPVGFVPRLKMAAEIFTPIAVLVGLALAWKRTEIADQQARTAAQRADTAYQQAQTAAKQAETAAKQAETAASQVWLVERGQVTERFTKSVEQLGSKERTIRLGAIYSLERIAKDSKEDRGTIAEVLCSFVRDWKTREDPRTEEQEGDEEQAGGRKKSKRLPEDVLAALAVLGDAEWRENGLDEFDRDLRRIDFSGRDLGGRSLRGLGLEDAVLRGANLQGAFLEGAFLLGAILEGANLEYADLEAAHLLGTNLRCADLVGAGLQGAYLVSANSLTQDQINEAYGDSKTILPGHLTRPEHWKD